MSDEQVRKCVLIVDDNVTSRELLQLMLGRRSAALFIDAADGLEAKKIMETLLPDLVICDIEMPRLKGTDFFRSLQSSGISVPSFIFFSAGCNEEDKAVAAEADGLFYKPHQLMRMCHAAEKALQ